METGDGIFTAIAIVALKKHKYQTTPFPLNWLECFQEMEDYGWDTLVHFSTCGWGCSEVLFFFFFLVEGGQSSILETHSCLFDSFLFAACIHFFISIGPLSLLLPFILIAIGLV